MCSVYHYLNKDELIQLVETIEHDLRIENEKLQQKCEIVAKRLHDHDLLTCHVCKKWELNDGQEKYYLSDHNGWLDFIDESHEYVYTNFKNSFVYHCSCMACECPNQICIPCGSESTYDQQHHLVSVYCQDCKQCEPQGSRKIPQ